ncbi:MAG TPA: redoxin domain-containing protein [Gemmataceae bacterium]|nr:redoxin domain-containing protein [Gemmataceae bacterium]
MIELGQLEARHQDFDSRHVRVVAVSLDGLDGSTKTQNKFPHLVVVSDKKKSLAMAAELIAPQHSPAGGDTVAPTTVLIDRRGEVRWLFRPDRFIERLSPDQVLEAVDEQLPAGG